MPPSKKKPSKGQTVFFGRETAVRREDVEMLLPTVESNSENEDEDPQVVSDLLDSESSGENEDFSTPPEEAASTPKRRLSASISDKDKSTSSKLSQTPPPKRQRRTKKAPVAEPRRSSRVSTTAGKPEQKAVSAKKTGRGRPPKKPGKAKASSPPKPEGEEWEVEKIVDSQIDVATQEHFYRVKWKGYPAKDNTWEPKKNLNHCLKAIREYEGGLKG